MDEWLPLAITIGTILLLLWSGHWANRRYADFEMLPGHYDWVGRASRMTPRNTMVWLLPIMFSLMMIVIAGAMYYVPEEHSNGDPFWGLLIAATSLLGAQAFVLWLTDRWARQQRGER